MHQLLMTVAGLCCLYNACGFVVKQEPHLAYAALGYGLLAGWERYIVTCHVTKP